MKKIKPNIFKQESDRMFSNPFYCMTIDETMCTPHEPLITEETFISVGVKLIAEIGAEAYLKNLLENLKGNYV